MTGSRPYARRAWQAFWRTAALGVLLTICTTAHGQGSELVCTAGATGATCDVNLRARFDAALQKRLRSGFSNTVLYRLYLRRVSDDEVVALTAWRVHQVYELWDEVHYVTQGNEGERRRIGSHGGLLTLLSEFKAIPVAKGLPADRYYVDLIVEVNPLGSDEEAEIRSWIARSRGGHRTFAAGDRSFLGTFVSLFVNIRPGSAERAFRVTTPPLRVGATP